MPAPERPIQCPRVLQHGRVAVVHALNLAEELGATLGEVHPDGAFGGAAVQFKDACTS